MGSGPCRKNCALVSRWEERDELDVAVEAMAPPPRMARLVRYLGNKYFQREIDQFHEYDIAIEVFGRFKTAFDAGENAIVRIESHRLRKRLKEFYDAEGRDYPAPLSIPAGACDSVLSAGLTSFQRLYFPGISTTLSDAAGTVTAK